MALTCQTDSRIADASGNWQENCNIDVTNWNISNEFILASYALSDSVNPDSDFKLQWRRVGGSFADVEADIYILVDGDDTYHAKSVVNMIKLLVKNKLDMVNGARFFEESTAYRPGHLIGNRILSNLVRTIFGKRLKTCFQGFEFFRVVS